MLKHIKRFEYKLWCNDKPCICNCNTELNKQVMICSVSKVFGYIAILILQEKGLLEITDTIDKYGIIFRGSDNIRICDLLEHKTNIPSHEIYETIMNKHKTDDELYFTHDWTKEDIIKELNKYENKRTDKWNYCSIGFSLIGMIIENVYKTVPESIYELILKPLNMKHTESQRNLDPEGYEFKYPDFDIAGNMMSTIEDMHIFLTSKFIDYIPKDLWYYDEGYLKLDGYNPEERGIFFLCIKHKGFDFVGYFRPCHRGYTGKIVNDVIETIDFLIDNNIKPFIIPDYVPLEYVKNEFQEVHDASYYVSHDLYHKYKKNRIYCHPELKLIKVICIIDLKEPDDDPDWKNLKEDHKSSVISLMNTSGIQKIYIRQVFLS